MLYVPLFSGVNVLNWLFQIQHFFSFHQTSPEQRLSIAAFYIMSLAYQWYHWMHVIAQLAKCETFTYQVELCFRPLPFANHEAQLYKLKQRLMAANYLTEFEKLFRRIVGLNSSNLLNYFLSRLWEDIQQELYLHKPQSVHKVIRMAKLVKDKCIAR